MLIARAKVARNFISTKKLRKNIEKSPILFVCSVLNCNPLLYCPLFPFTAAVSPLSNDVSEANKSACFNT